MRGKRTMIFIIAALLLAFCLGGCSDQGTVQYLDEELLRELLGERQESEEASETTQESVESGEETQESEESSEATQESVESSEETQESVEESSEESPEEGEESSMETPNESLTEEASESDESSESDETSENGETEEEEARDQAMNKLLIGSWKSEAINVEDVVMDALKAAGQYEPYLKIDKTKLRIHANFACFQDGRARMEIDSKSYQELMDYLTGEVTSAVLRYYQDKLAEHGLHVSVEQYLKLLGIRAEDYVSIIMQDSMEDFDLSDYRRECRCIIEHGRLYVANDSRSLEMRENYLEITLDESKLVFEKYYESGKIADAPLGLDVTLPITFTR